MNQTFTQKFFFTVSMGFVAACLFWVYQHIVARAIYETSDEGYRDSLKGEVQRYR